MGNEPSQLKTTDTLNGAALRTDEVESNLNDSWLHRDVVFDVQTRGVVAEEEHWLMNKPNHVSKLEKARISVEKRGYWQDDEEDGVKVVKFARQGMHVVEISTMIFAEVLGRALSGRHHIKQFNESTNVKITECNIGRFLTRLEGLRGFFVFEVSRRLIVQST
ncbi:hypothetical protein Bca4012_084051 [Brassica carinata]